MDKKNLGKKFAAYSLAAGAAAGAVNLASSANAAMMVYNNGGAGWYDAGGYSQDLISFKMDGTVVVNSGDLGSWPYYDGPDLGQDDKTFTFQHLDFFWFGSDEKDATTLMVGADCGYMTNMWPWGGGDWTWEVGRLGFEEEISAAVGPVAGPSNRGWAGQADTDDGIGGLGGWYFYFHGEWPFGGTGYVGLYVDDVDGRHYGWAYINMTAYNAVELYEFAFSDTPGMGVLAGGGEIPEPVTLGLLAMGATGLLARRKR
jgi:hypothetical protein